MHLTKAGFNFLVVVWLAPLIVLDFVGNTISTGIQSDVFYYKMMADGLLAAYACYEIFFGISTATTATAQSRQADHSDDVVGFESLGAWEYIYCALLAFYAAANWYELHALNKQSTGIESAATLAWSFVSLAVVLLSAVQFWHLKSGAIVQLKKAVIQ